MRKLMAAVMLAAIICTLAVSAWGAEEGLDIRDVTVAPGETVYVTIKLAAPVKGNSVAVTYNCNDNILKPIESSSTWAQKGALQDFDSYKKTGVWATTQTVELKGEICTLAFRVVTEEKHFDTKVICALKVKNGPSDIVSYTEEVWVSTACEHSFGAWTNDGSALHLRSCKICGRTQHKNHQWDEGTTAKDPNRENMEITTFRCEDCGAKKEVKHVSNATPTVPEETIPEEPQSTRPTLPMQPDEPTMPTQGSTEPTSPTEPSEGGTNNGNQPTEPNQGGTNTTVPSDNDEHNHGTVPSEGHDHETEPTDDHETTPTKGDGHDHGTTPTIKDEHDHDHDHSDENVIPVVDSETQMKNALVFIVTCSVLIVAALLFLKKKR